MQKAIDVVAGNFNTMRTGRANPAILDRIQVSAAAHSTQFVSTGYSSAGPATGRALACASAYPCT